MESISRVECEFGLIGFCRLKVINCWVFFFIMVCVKVDMWFIVIGKESI